MKKFLIFLVAIITTVCIGVTFYQFAKNDEVIKVKTQTIYINYGDKLTLEDIGFSRKEASKETKINFNAGGDEVTSIIKFDELSQSYIPTSKGGSTTIKITTTNRKYKSFSIDVIVGIGTAEFPYYISTEEQLFDVTTSHIDDGACFELVNDIKLTQVHTPIGLIDDGYREFTGKFNGKYHTISNLQIESCDYAGLFAIMGANSQVYNLNIDSANINGSFINVGAVAGKCYGTINKVVVSNATITNNRIESNTGAVVGLLETDNINKVNAGILRTSAYTDKDTLITANGNLGGLAGIVNSASIHACYTKLSLKNTSTAPTGGLVGKLIVDSNTYIRESYCLAKIETSSTAGNLVGIITLAPNTQIENIEKSLVLVGLYYENELNTFEGVGSDENGFANISTFAVNGKSTTEMKNKATYIYYVNSANNIIYWDKVWYLVDGDYPSLTFISQFDEIVLEGETNQQPTTPDDPTTPDISNPDAPSTSAVIISNKEELITAFQNKELVSGNYILGANIDLGGIEWKPVMFNGTFKSSENQNYVISNFKIVGNNLLYAGFFYNLANATITNITFDKVSLSSNTDLEACGIVVGFIRGNTSIENVNVSNATISATSKYAGGITGYIGDVITIIKNCSVNSFTTNDSSLLVLGGITGYTANSSYILSCKVKNSTVLTGVSHVGGIAGINYGHIWESLFNGSIKSNSSTTDSFFGGLAGYNGLEILDSVAYAEINVINTSAYYYVGGLVGYNVGMVSNSTVYGNEFSAKQSTSYVYMAGLTGYNSGTLEYCVADVLNIGSVDDNIYVSGLSIFNYGGKIFGCFAFGNLNGYQVSGLVNTNTNDGTIDSCMAGLNESDRATYKGVNVMSFAYCIYSGTISNCIVSADLNCTNPDGWIAGFAGFMPYEDDKFGTLTHSIANVSFSGMGDKYLDIASNDLMTKKRETGTITNCVISSDADVANVIVSEHDKFLWITYDAGSNSNYIIANASKLTNIDTYLNPNDCNFNISAGLTDSKWLYINDKLPIPRPYLDIYGYDIIGLG